MQYLGYSSPYYQRLFKEHSINFSSIQTLDDLAHLPTTSKADMQEHQADFLCVPNTDIREYTATSGTMGKPVSISLTENDLQRLAYNEHQSFLCADGKAGDIYQLMLTLDRQFMAGMAYYSGIRRMGAASIRTGPGMPQMQLDTIKRLGTNSLVAVPSFIIKMIEYAEAHGIDLKQSGIGKAVCIGEPLRDAEFNLNALGKKIADHWAIALHSTYASTEMQTAFTECKAGKGGHHQPDLIITEILDEDGNQLGEGAWGELTITTLGVEGTPLLRYRTGDICCYYSEPCSCGRQSIRLSPVIGRRGQMIKYKGTTLYPPALFDTLEGIDVIESYVVEAYSNSLGMDEIKLHLHSNLAPDECIRRIIPIIKSALRVVPEISFVDAATIRQMQFPENSRKVVRFIDYRKRN